MYGKLFATMYDGTLGTRGPWEALVTFQQLIILCDQDGVVDMTPEAISRRTLIPLEIIAKGLSELELPDPHSRSPDEDGRRIVRLSTTRPWGWRIVNYLKYRAIRSGEERREYHRQYWHKRRKAAQQTQQALNNSTKGEGRRKGKKQFKTLADRRPQPKRGKGNVNGGFLPSTSTAKGNGQGAQQEKATGHTLDTWAEANGITRSSRETEDAFRRRAIDAYAKSKVTA